MHSIRLDAVDEHGNRAVLRYRVRRDDGIRPPERDTTVSSSPWIWFTQNGVTDGSMAYFLPAGALYNNINFTWRKVSGPDPSRGIVSDVWEIGSPDIPLQMSGELEIEADIPEGLEEKAYMARYGKTLASSGVQVGFGTYCVAVDTVPPTMTFLGNKGQIVSGSTIRIRVADNASGVASARVEIDGKWYLSMLKGDVISLELKENRLKRGKHEINVTVTDICGNEASETRTFSY